MLQQSVPPKIDAVKETMLAAAMDVFAELGYYAAPVDLIAQRAGVSKGLVFWHFRSKDELIRQVEMRSLPLDVFEEALARGIAGIDLLRVIADGYMRKYSDETMRQLLMHTMSAKNLHPEVAKEFAALCTKTLTGVAAKVYGHVDEETVTRMRAFLGGLMCYVMNPHVGMKKERYVAHLVDLIAP